MENAEQTIVECIKNQEKKKPDGLTIEEVSKSLGIHRITASKYLAVLEARGLIEHREIGKAKLFTVKRKFL